MTDLPKLKNKINLSRNKNKIWFVSGLAILLSFIGFISSWINPSIKLPLRPGLDFTGGTQIRIERECQIQCKQINSSIINEVLNDIELPNTQNSKKLFGARVQFLDGDKSLLLRLPALLSTESDLVLQAMIDIVGPVESGGQSIETIGPTLGAQLLRTTLISLLVAFSGVAIYISFRFDRKFSLYALFALLHDLIIVCGVFSWLGILMDVEVNSLFAVALLTIAGYSVNDTVVVFDRIRELKKNEDIPTHKQKIDLAVSATLTRTLYTSGTTLLPLFALIFFGGSTLYWFAITLAIGVIVGSWSSIALVPSLLTLEKES